MKRTTKYVVLAVFVVVTIVSLILFGMVKINYNISDYLDEKTETKISLEIMEDQFGTTGNIQVMVENVTVDEAFEIGGIIRKVPNVLLVNFSPDDDNYFKKDNANDTKGDALFAVITNGDEYSSTAATVLEDIKVALNDHFDGEVNYGGAVVEKINMRNTMRSEIVIILAIAVVFALAIMLVMASSWVEPFILIAASFVAVGINMGTNIIFGEISYITAAVAAILQLALSIDYSIVLLHNFRALKSEYDNKQDAMLQAIKITWRPVLASAGTTAAGLLALIFMTMKIGRDIGLVLTKGIAISMITSLTLLPALLLVCDNFMQKLSKRDLVLTGKKLCSVAFKGGKAIVALALAVIILCGVLNAQNTYIFTDSANPNQQIIDRFGSNNTLVVVYPNNRIDWNQEKELADKLAAFTNADGTSPFQGYTSYSNTVREIYSIEMAATKLNIPREKVEDLFKMYHSHNNDSNNRKLSPLEFVEYSLNLIESNPDEVGAFVDESTVNTLEMMRAIYDITNGTHSYQELHELVSTGAMAGTGLSEFQIRQMYGLYFWDTIEDKTVPFEDMLAYMVELTYDEDGSTLMDEQTASDLRELLNGLGEFKEKMNSTITKEEFRQFGREELGDHPWMNMACDTVFNAAKGDKSEATLVDILKLADSVNAILTAMGIDQSYIDMIKNYSYVYDVLDDPCTYEEYLPILEKVVWAMTREKRELSATNESVQQGYIMYFNKQNAISYSKIKGIEFIEFVNNTIETNPAISDNLGESSRLKLQDVVLVDEFVSNINTYNSKDMVGLLQTLQSNIKSLTSSSGITGGAIEGIYFKYVDENVQLPTDDIMALELLEYVANNMNNPDSALYQAITPEYKVKVEERKQAIDSAQKLFLGETYNRMLISVDLPSESEDSSRFVQYLMDAVNEVYGDGAHVAGHMVSTYELQQTFEKDNKIISILTIVAIFLIIMIVFKSISLPVILVAIIQGAIWISMSTSLITGPMFFMSYIIATCILMGSTIDYGILMSTNYIGYRKTMDKKEALYAAVKAAMPTIFTSGLILVICGFIVGIVASMTSISTVGTLLGKGTLVSILMITLVLPSALYVLDGLILKLTFNGKKKDQ